YVLTNNHVAGGAEEMTITLSDGREIKKENCKLLGADPKSDLAVVKIQADRLIPAKWGNSDDLQKGDWIMAFGSPFAYDASLTSAATGQDTCVRSGDSVPDRRNNLELATRSGDTADQSVLVEPLLPKPPATAKLQPGDIVTKLDGKPVETVQQLRNTLAMTAP